MTALRFVGAAGVVTHAGGGVIDVNFSGLGGSTYKHTQGSASDTWTVNHNLGYNPTVQVFNSGGQVVIADISHTSLNQTVISASLAFSGYALFT